MDRITDDCLLLIFGNYLPLKDVWSISRTCVRFHNICNSLHLKRITINNEINQLDADKFNELMELCGHSVHSIKFYSSRRKADINYARSIVKNCNNLSQLELGKVSLKCLIYLSTNIFYRLGSLFLNIKRPEKGLDSIMQNIKFRHLKELHIKNSYLGIDLSKFDIVGLEILHLNNSRVKNMLELFKKNKHTLTNIFLRHMSFPEEELHDICDTLPQLRVFSIKTDNSALELGNLSKLTSLRLCGKSLQADALLQNMASFNRLEHLRLDYVTIKPETFRHLAMMTSLKSLCLADLKYLNAVHLQMLNENSFEQVVFLDCYTNKMSLTEFVKMSPKLRHFKTETLLPIHDDDYNELINSRPELHFDVPTFWKRDKLM